MQRAATEIVSPICHSGMPSVRDRGAINGFMIVIAVYVSKTVTKMTGIWDVDRPTVFVVSSDAIEACVLGFISGAIGF